MKHDMESDSLNPQLHRPSVLLLALFFSLVLPGAAQQITSGAVSASVKAVPKVTSKEYVVGEPDVLRINVWKEPEISQPSIVVRPDGRISLPLIGEVKVSGMTPREIEAVLVERLQATALKDARVTVTVVETGSKIVYVTGQVAKPGAYPLVMPTDVLQIIAKAGGLTPFAHSKAVFVLRQAEGGKQKLPVNYAQVLRGHNPEQNLNLQPGDTVVIP